MGLGWLPCPAGDRGVMGRVGALLLLAVASTASARQLAATPRMFISSVSASSHAHGLSSGSIMIQNSGSASRNRVLQLCGTQGQARAHAATLVQRDEKREEGQAAEAGPITTKTHASSSRELPAFAASIVEGAQGLAFGAVKSVQRASSNAAASAAQSVQRTADAAAAEVKAIPGKVVDAVTASADAARAAAVTRARAVAEEVAAVPGRAQAAAARKAQEAAAELSEVPVKLREAMVTKIDEAKGAAVSKAERTLDEVRGTPDRMRSAVAEAAGSAASKVRQKVQGVRSEVDAVRERLESLRR